MDERIRIKLYLLYIRTGKMKIDNVPVAWREKVREKLK